MIKRKSYGKDVQDGIRDRDTVETDNHYQPDAYVGYDLH